MVIHKKVLFFALLFLAGMIMLSYAEQQAFETIFIGYLLSFAGYFIIILDRGKGISSFWPCLILAIVARFCLIFCFPALSDDIYRFYWDGLMSHGGLNPYSLTPEQLLSNGIETEGIDISLFEQLNSPGYYSIYPPFSQLLFYLASFGDSITSFSIALKSLFFVGEAISIGLIMKLLQRLQLPKDHTLVYALNPLVIMEGMGNLHFEVMLIPFIALFLFLLVEGKWLRSAIPYTLAIGTKLTPLIMGPAILFYLWNARRIWRFILFGFLLFVLIFTPVLMGLNFHNLGESVDLYFRKFEFNASIYYIFREIGYAFSGYNRIHAIGPFLALSTIGLVLNFARMVKANDLMSLIKFTSYSYLVYLLLATTVHPWYLIPLIFLSVYYRLYGVLVWSFSITLSYYTYSSEGWEESWYILLLEYLPVMIVLCVELDLGDLIKKRRTYS